MGIAVSFSYMKAAKFEHDNFCESGHVYFKDPVVNYSVARICEWCDAKKRFRGQENLESIQASSPDVQTTRSNH